VISIVGSETLLGRELREALSEHGFKNVQLIGAQDELAITTSADEVAVITPLDKDRLQDSEVIFCAGTAASTRKAFESAPEDATFIDLTYGLEDVPEARLRAPMVDAGEPVSRVPCAGASRRDRDCSNAGESTGYGAALGRAGVRARRASVGRPVYTSCSSRLVACSRSGKWRRRSTTRRSGSRWSHDTARMRPSSCRPSSRKSSVILRACY
jgi:hypothetical protein